MARTVTIADLRADVREVIDKESENLFIDDPEIDSVVNESIAALHSILALIDPGRYSDSAALTSTTAATLPTDHYLTVKVESVFNGQTVIIPRIDMDEYIRRANVTTGFPGYIVTRNTMRFRPAAQANPTIWYVPAQPIISGATTFDGADGWEQWVRWDAAIKLLVKEETDVTVLRAERDEVERRIVAQASHRDVGEPPKMIDTAAWANWPPFYPRP